MILNCYRLADRFKQNPDVFLRMPLSEIAWHVYYTIMLMDVQAAARARNEDDDE